ncbi:fatty acid--CoA ligase FadD11 [Mycobacterium sp. 1274756.6]|uniref:fatty acid--CoA ligase FadD11 n=1 Tax=Mycobacterium sp. 1274756.6 TaxID=1834076 RepID=UPI000801860D|nr:fatty acid--CoA ligase FadD11 [Mycobacterium sp. 1274756.6]OBJ68019.1 AMP-dependent synthetase [Mycobacterium sp. 1274756.6]
MGTQAFDTLVEAFQHTATIAPDAVAVRTPGHTQVLSWREYAAQVRQVAAGLAALGVRRGDTVALMMSNRVEFYPLEVGAQHLGATSFSVYNTLAPEQISYVLGNAGARVVICEPQHVERIRASGVDLDHIVCVDEAPAGTLAVSDLIDRGAADFDFATTWRAVRPEDVATLIYTSGTTGNPKGVETTHANLMYQAYSVASVLGVEFGDRMTSYLPSAHIADRFTSLYLQEVFGTEIIVVGDPKLIGGALPDARPTIWGGVPRVWEKLKAGLELAVAGEPDENRRDALQWAMAVGAKRGSYQLGGHPIPEDVAAEWTKADELVLSALRTKLGLDRLKWALVGGSPVPPETLAFFAGLGVPMSEIWGMSELSCLCTVSPPHEAKLGAVGRLLPGMEAKIADDGELLIRGPLVMKGYRREPQKTAEAIDTDRWLHTGDVAYFDDDGYLRVVDRKKELIISSGGKNMSPANIENAIKAETPLIGAISVIGDNRPYVTALIVLDAESAEPYAAQHGLASAAAVALAADPDVVAEIADGVAKGNARLSRVEQVKKFRILPTFWEPGGEELTLTLKIKRRTIVEKYAQEIDDMYAPGTKPGVHEVVAGESTVSAS